MTVVEGFRMTVVEGFRMTVVEGFRMTVVEGFRMTVVEGPGMTLCFVSGFVRKTLMYVRERYQKDIYNHNGLIYGRCVNGRQEEPMEE
ncbi:MAG TPA: hypothetical protein ENG86_05095 [Nitrospirae bacterium]|nr:hypothetical protein [Nitrospirota bacterium]